MHNNFVHNKYVHKKIVHNKAVHPSIVYSGLRNAAIPHMQIYIREVDSLLVNVSTVGELCAAECRTEKGQTILIVTCQLILLISYTNNY